MEVQLHSFLLLALHGCEGLIHSQALYPQRKCNPGPLRNALICLQTVFRRGKFSFSCIESIHGPAGVQPVAHGCLNSRRQVAVATEFRTAASNVCHHHHHHHYHHIYVMKLGHLLTRSGLTYPEVSSKVLLPVGEQCFIILGNLLRGILFTCCIQFLLYSSDLSKNLCYF